MKNKLLSWLPWLGMVTLGVMWLSQADAANRWRHRALAAETKLDRIYEAASILRQQAILERVDEIVNRLDSQPAVLFDAR